MSAKKRRDMHSEFMSMTHEERMNKFYSYQTQGLHHKDPIPLDGPTAPGGGGVKRRKQPVKKMPEYLKTFGM
jgi:hypothetical protein